MSTSPSTPSPTGRINVLKGPDPQELPRTKTGPDLLAEIREFTLDEALRRNPHSVPLSDEELLALTKHLRIERTQIEVKKEQKREKKNDKD